MEKWKKSSDLFPANDLSYLCTFVKGLYIIVVNTYDITIISFRDPLNHFQPSFHNNLLLLLIVSFSTSFLLSSFLMFSLFPVSLPPLSCCPLFSCLPSSLYLFLPFLRPLHHPRTPARQALIVAADYDRKLQIETIMARADERAR